MLVENKLEFEKQTDFSISSSQPQLPKDHQWLLILENMKIKGLADGFKFVYGDEISDKIKKFAYDEEKGGIGVVRPDKVLLIKKKREGYLIEDEVVGEIDFRRHVDPDFNESMLILDVLKRIE
jgi:hypothetical protein